MRHISELQRIAREHNVSTTKRIFFERYEGNRKVPTFIDVDKPARELQEELTDLGHLQQRSA